MGEETKEARRERNARPHNRAARRAYMRSEQGRRVADRAKARYASRHPERARAQAHAQATQDAPESHRCKVCGKPAEHRHHPDYGSPGSVEWLCHTHHVKAHHPRSNLSEKSQRGVGGAGGGGGGSAVNFDPDASAAVLSLSLDGGRADDMKLEDFDEDALVEGAAHELEHTDDPETAVEIAMDHLAEDPHYYEKLERAAKATPPAEYRRQGATTADDYADPKNFKYPIHDEAHVRAALSYFSMPKNREKYSPEERAAISSRIERRAKRFGIETEKEKAVNDIFKAIMSRDAFCAKSDDNDADDDGKNMDKGPDGGMSGGGMGGGDAARMYRACDAEAMKSHVALERASVAIDAARTFIDSARRLAKGPVPGMPRSIAHQKREPDVDDEAAEAEEKALVRALGQLERAEAAVKSARASSDTILKALAMVEHGESTSGDSLGASRALPGSTAPDPTEAGSMHGMPSVSPGQAVTFSADDHGLAPGKGALESTVPSGSAGLESSVNVAMSKAGALGASATFENERQRAALNKGARGLGQSAGVVLTIPSTSEDLRISALLEKAGPGGSVMPEPSLTWQSPIVARRACTMCKSLVPAMFAACPSCGTDHDGAARPGTMYVEKSVLDTIRRPPTRDTHQPNGLRIED